jgi:hypothetical protein
MRVRWAVAAYPTVARLIPSSSGSEDTFTTGELRPATGEQVGYDRGRGWGAGMVIVLKRK